MAESYYLRYPHIARDLITFAAEDYDHEGTGAVYSALPDGSDLRRHTDLGPYYARHATTDGQRVVYQRAGEIWMLESLDAEPVRLDIRPSGDRSGRASCPVSATSQLGSFTLDSTGRAVGAEVRGTVHWLPGPDEPARALLAEPGVRGRLPGRGPRSPARHRRSAGAAGLGAARPRLRLPSDQVISRHCGPCSVSMGSSHRVPSAPR